MCRSNVGENEHHMPGGKSSAIAAPVGHTPGSRTMAYTGTLILAFIIIHVATFKFDVGGLKGQTPGVEVLHRDRNDPNLPEVCSWPLEHQTRQTA